MFNFIFQPAEGPAVEPVATQFQQKRFSGLIVEDVYIQGCQSVFSQSDDKQ